MLRVSIFNQDHEAASFLLDKSLIRIGRAPENDVCLGDLHISNEHIILRKKEDGWLLEDVSRNGIFSEVDEWLPSKLSIQTKTRICLSRLTKIEIDPLTSKPIAAKKKTILSSRTRTELIKISPQGVQIGRAKIKFQDASGKWQSQTMDSPSLTIGSHPSNDIVVESEKISQFHCRIDLCDNRFFATDLRSTNGSFLNGIRIQRAPLEGRCDLQLAQTLFIFEVEMSNVELSPPQNPTFMGMISDNPKMKKLFSIAEVAAESSAPVFIFGETGTGKELLAQAIHKLSRRDQGPFIALNCAAIPKDLLESEVFGHEKGAFTGATQAREGAFEAAHGGTLFLDEIGEMDLALQAKLLRALETGEIRRVGSNRSIQVSVRIVSATHRNLLAHIEAGKFREDLFYRLHVLPLEIPPLRDRINDLDLLVPHFLKSWSSEKSVSNDAIVALKSYNFPGNIRELKNILQRALVEYEINLGVRQNKNELNLNHFRFLEDLRHFRPALLATEVSEREKMLKLLEESHFNRSEAARRMGVAISTFHDRMRRYGLEKDRLSRLAS